jgi:hypothetical protein
MARPVEVGRPAAAAAVPVRGSAAYVAAHGHGGGCPFGECAPGTVSAACPGFTACGVNGCTCEYVFL